MNERIGILLLAIGLSGCVNMPEEPMPASPRISNAVMKPDVRPRGRIKTVNLQGQYVIVDFGLAMIPPLGSEMNVYQEGEISGVIKLTGPVRGSVVAGDILTGEAEANDLAILDPPGKDEESPPEE